MKLVQAAALSAVALTLAGCASAIDGTTQTISIATAPADGAACTASNSRGSWDVTSPGAVVIKKSESVLTIRCRKDGYKDGTYYASGHMTTAGTIGVMLPYVGVLSAAADASSGAILTYPDSYIVTLKPLPAANAAAPAAASSAAAAAN